jgi:serine/threonine-protein kinase ATR
MSALSAACMESYGRAYPMLARLQSLHELQSGYELCLQDVDRDDSNKKDFLEALGWESRLNFMSPSVPQRSAILAVRRSILGVCKMPQQVAQNWLQLSDSMRRLGKFDAAHLAVRNAESFGLDAESVLLQECRILRESGEVARALMLLEPVEVDQAAIHIALRNNRQGVAWPACLDSELKRKALAERIKLATQLMVDSKQKQGNVIISRYKTVIALDKYWMEAYFDLAKYYEFLYHDARTKQAQTLADLQAMLDSPNSHNPPANAKGPTPLALLQQQLPMDTQVMCTNLQQAIEMFANCLMLGHELAMQVLPRLLTLWLTFTATQDDGAALAGELQRTGSTGNGSGAGGRRAEGASVLVAAQKRANDSMAKVCGEVPASTWYLCMSQLVSRVLHRNEDTVKVVVSILLKILAAYPKEGIWHMAGLMFSINGERKKIAKKLLQDTYKVLSAAKSVDAAMLVDSQKLCSKLIDLAVYQCKERKIRWTMHPDVKLENFLVPTQAVLHHTNPLRLLDPGAGTGSPAPASTANYYHSDRMYIASFNETVDVANSKAKPKTLTLRTQCGKTVRFLCKQEKDGDLRKDARMMEFNTVVNRLLQECPDGRKRNLRLRTFAVVCLNEECGILEWVNNTDCLRQLINKAHSFWPDLYPTLPYKEVYQDIVDLQTKPDDDIPRMMQQYARLMAECQYRPCFHRWFLEQFPDPTAWQEARARFVRSAAVWSAVGHVIGLGDRHTENILLDVTNGEMVHVDFDCLFDKGLTLQRPEIVPFRLTPNVVDAMGVTGVEGAYRRTLEVTMSVLREHRDTLLSVLEPFLRDPTVSWSRSGRAQRSLEATAAAAAAVGSTTAAGSRSTVPARDHENREAKEMLLKISQRLNGVYNVVHPHREKFVRAAARRNEPAPARGIGVSKEEMLPLSVPGQVQRLIDEATAPENLVQMYIGKCLSCFSLVLLLWSG